MKIQNNTNANQINFKAGINIKVRQNLFDFLYRQRTPTIKANFAQDMLHIANAAETIAPIIGKKTDNINLVFSADHERRWIARYNNKCVADDWLEYGQLWTYSADYMVRKLTEGVLKLCDLCEVNKFDKFNEFNECSKDHTKVIGSVFKVVDGKMTYSEPEIRDPDEIINELRKFEVVAE